MPEEEDRLEKMEHEEIAESKGIEAVPEDQQRRAVYQIVPCFKLVSKGQHDGRVCEHMDPEP